MTKKYYDYEELILRDRLAIDRTILANERTYLAYIRTALALFAAGASFLQFFSARWIDAVGYALIVSGVMLLTVGSMRFFALRRAIVTAKQETADT